ncbi:MAG: transporter permease, putative transport system permease protein [Candidatus Saccharibacteria bacterium]|nr:transporter permease, putative transport system permease protein [Candidatus Saccharibacteria bacterium]
MNVVTRGIRNAFRNQIRTFSIVVILGLSVGLALAMLVARQAVTDKISSVKSSVGNTVSVSPAGARGFEGGGTALTTAQIAKLATLANVTSVDSTLSDRLTTSNSNLASAVDAGSLGQRFAQNNGTSFSGGEFQGQRPSGATSGTSDSETPVMRTFTPPVTVVGTTSPTKLSSSVGGGSFTLKSGKTFSATSTENVAVIGSSLATKNNLKVGSTFTAYNTSITVIGTFDAGNSFSNNQVLMPLATVQKLSDQAGAVTSATIHVNSIDNVATVTTAATSSLGSAADVTNDSAAAESSVAPLENIQTISLYSLIGAVTAGAVIILLTMIMIVRERRREIGVIKAIGASNIKVMLQFASEAVTFTILGAVIGIIFGLVAGNPITKLLVNNSTSAATTATTMGGPGGFGGRGGGRALRSLGSNFSTISASVGWDIILYGLGVAIIIAIIGSGLASFFIAKIRPAEVMRAE